VTSHAAIPVDLRSPGIDQTDLQTAMSNDMTITTSVLALLELDADKVLLVDDEPIMITALTDPIECAGFKVASCSTGTAALELLEQEFRPIMVVDRSMPELDGIELCREIRRRNWPGYVYIILHTGRDDEADILEGLQAGADDYVSKRSSIAQLMARLRTAQRVTALERSLKGAIQERSRIANTDALTGAPNRRYFNRRMARDVRASGRSGKPLSLLLLDIDHFKSINDRFGHGTGDEILVQLVERLRSLLPRDCDWLARLGGEEFAIVLPFTGTSGARKVAERLRRGVAEHPMRTARGEHRITVSIGVGSADNLDSLSTGVVDDLLTQADAFLYVSKKSGRNRTCASTDHVQPVAASPDARPS